MQEIINKLRSGEALSEREIKELTYCGYMVDQIKGANGRWTQSVRTILNIEGELWAVDWYRGLTEYQENEFPHQPYRVRRVERVVTRTEVDYEPIE